MKSFTRVIILFIAPAILTLSACQKDDDNNNNNTNPPPTQKNFLEAKVNGVLFNDMAEINISYDATKGVVDIVGKHKDQVKVMSLIFSINSGTNLDFSNANQANGAYQPTAQEVYQSKSGTLTLTKNDKSARIVEGTFSFDAEELTSGAPMSVTEGKFSAKY